MKNEHATRLEYERIKMVDRMDQKDAEITRLREVLSALNSTIEGSIKGNDGPNRFWVGGVALEGPHADQIFKILRKIQNVCRRALEAKT